MRGRLRRKLQKRAAFAKLRAVVRYAQRAEGISGQQPGAALRVRYLLFLCDLEACRVLGRPLLPRGFSWIKATDGPALVWRGLR